MSDTPTKALANAATRRSHKIVELLAGRFYDGMANKELSEALGTSAVNISRDLMTLEAIGYARKLENGRWGLSARPLSIMQAYYGHYQQMQDRMHETTRNIMAAANNYTG